MADKESADLNDEPTASGATSFNGSEDDYESGAGITDRGVGAVERDEGDDTDDTEDADDTDAALVSAAAPVAAGRRSGASTEAARAARPGAGPQEVVTTSRGKKDRATPRHRAGAPRPTRTGPATFVRESVGELRKVVYPTGPQLLNYFLVVLVFVLFVIAVVSLLDLAFGAAILKLFS